VLWNARPVPHVRRAGVAAAVVLIAAYAWVLHQDVRLWDVRARVSQAAVADVEREALAAPPGTLIIAGAPRRSWDFAVPHALRPPYTREDLTRRARVISDSSIYCCPANVWEPDTRRAMNEWAADPSRPPVIALHWNQDTGRVSRLSSLDEPFLRELVGLLRETPDVASLDRILHDILTRYVAGR